MSNFGKLLVQKKQFIAMVYLVLASQLYITFIVAKYLQHNQKTYIFAMKFFIPLIIIPFIILFTLPYCPPYLKFILFCIFSFVLGILSIGASNYVSEEIIEVALVSAICIFIAMSFVGIFIASMGIDLSFTFFILFTILIGLVIVRLVLLFMTVSSDTYDYVATLSIVLFSLFVGVDTNRMLQKNYNLGVIETAMTFYLDIENLFTNLVELQMNR
jgi:FtsH-binding integral membrane protein